MNKKNVKLTDWNFFKWACTIETLPGILLSQVYNLPVFVETFRKTTILLDVYY